MNKTTIQFVLGVTITALAATPALSCGSTPQEKWRAIEAALPRAKLSDADLAKVNELREKAYALLRAAIAKKPNDAREYREAAFAARKAMKIIGLELVVEGPPFLRCGGGTYRLEGEPDAR